MKIIADENITFAQEAFSSIGEVRLLHGRKITNEELKGADALIVRSITNVNKELLHGTNIQFVGTATIGTDHIDEKYFTEAGIKFASAAGCNSNAVKEYALNAIFDLFVKNEDNLKNKSIGIIGAGNIGSKLVKIAETMGLTIVKNDPPLKRLTGDNSYSSLEEALNCDIITFHVPLNLTGIDKTVHLLNDKNIGLIKSGAVLINSSRGSVVDNQALKNRLAQRKDFSVILDVWEEEPNPDLELLELVDIGTPHIAGYSFEGKVNGTTMIYCAVCDHFNLEKKWEPKLPRTVNALIEINNSSLENNMHNILNHAYPIREDDKFLREIKKKNNISEYFDSLRKNYRYRRELNNYTVKAEGLDNKFKSILKELRINVI
ncbi:MAG: 4-phosphoerythronate dehydrogenase [Bacteroidetes bacterium]|nr:4-phosphoerythronate dehydrogenase [Bacteroidota bacterium]